tara:strand:+ start:2441 stop:3829 length:1389 start_codon:yes stop_codon:yes gene_type:complete
MAITDSSTGVDYSGDFYTYVLRNHFLPEVADGLNHDYVLLDYMSSTKDTSMVQGKYVQHPVHDGRNMGGVGPVGVGGKLPTPGAQSYTEFQYPMRSVYGRIKFTGLVADASATDIDSWLRAVDSELSGLRDDLARNENRMLHGNGSGIMGEIATAGADNVTQTVIFHTGYEGQATMDSSAVDTTQHIEIGDRIVLYSSAGDDFVPANSGSDTTAVVTAKTATTITLDNQLNTGTDTGPFFIVKANEGTAAVTYATYSSSVGFANEPMGLNGILSDGDFAATAGAGKNTVINDSGLTAGAFQNLAVSGKDFHQARLLSNSSVKRPLTESLIQNGLSLVEKSFKGNIDAFICSYGIRDAFADLMLTYRRHVNKTELKAGFSTVAYGDIPFIPDRDALPNRLMGIDKSDIRQHCMGSTDYRFIDEDGSIYHRLPDEHAYQAAMYRRYTYGVFCRARHLLITDLDE